MSASNPKRVIMGTAGHIDHGKTSLVRALTGIDTDRLKEEKERGITIELGFAHLALPNGIDLAIVDVPGHERFVKNMVAGASGIDFVLLTVAADEGVMPQTREHLEICSLLGIHSGLVALTKSDLVEPDLLALAQEDVAELVTGTFLAEAPVLPVSSATGAGLEALVGALDRLAAAVPQRSQQGLFRLPVDRVFTMRGFGTVVTGTVASGALRKDEEVAVLPGGRKAKVRGIQVHGKAADKAAAGQRAALNLSGIEVGELSRGDTVTQVESLRPTRMLDVTFQLLDSYRKPLRNRSRLRLHLGTQEVPVVVSLLGREDLAPGESAYVQMRSPEWLVACPGDHFVARAFSPAVTVGGGVVLDHQPKKHRGRQPGIAEQFDRLLQGSAEERLGVFLHSRDLEGMTPVEVAGALGVSVEDARNHLQATVRAGTALVTDRKSQRHHHREAIESLQQRAVTILERYHQANPLKPGMGIEELRTKFPAYVDSRILEFALQRLVSLDQVRLEGTVARKADFAVRLSTGDEGVRSRILAVLEQRGFEGPSLDEVAAAVGQDPRSLGPVIEYLVSQAVITRTKEGLCFATGKLEELVRDVVSLLQDKGEIGVADMKTLTGTTRKYSIPLLEYLDSKRITMRRGDSRVLGPGGRA